MDVYVHGREDGVSSDSARPSLCASRVRAETLVLQTASGPSVFEA